MTRLISPKNCQGDKIRLKLSKKWINHLIILPESGMGYQTVDIKLKNGSIIESVNIYNAEYLELPEGYGSLKVEDIKNIELHKK